jgi:threonine dehydrogenase-like Zn-dependent dehydrogenase
MRAAVLVKPGRFEVREAPLPTPEAGQIRVRVAGCGVCASNIPPWEGRDWFDYPFQPGQPGHEGWGVVDAVGAEVDGFADGDPVTFLSNSAYAEYDVAPAGAAVRLPETLAGHPFPGEPLGCAVNIFRRSGIQPGQSVAIVGVGYLGALLTRMATRAGARVVALSRREAPLAFARAAGAQVLAMHDHWQIIEQVRDWTGGAFCDVVIEATGKQWPLDLAAELTRERGRLVVAGYHQDGPRQVNMQLWNWRGLDVINAHERDPAVYLDGMRRAVAAAAAGELDPTPLHTHSFGLHALNEALAATRDRPEGFMKALLHIEA